MSLFGLSDDLLPHKARIEVIRGRSSSDVWAAGTLGALAHSDGSKWTRKHIDPPYSLAGLWLMSVGALAISTDTVAFALDVELEPSAPPAATSDGWFRIAEPTGPLPHAMGGRLNSIWMLAEAEWLWGTMLRGNVGLWRAQIVDERLQFETVLSEAECTAYGCGSMRGVHGASADDLWAVGSSGAILHVTNAQSAAPTYTPFNSHTLNELFGVWAATPDDAWIVGAQGTVFHYHDGGWELVEQPFTNEHLYAVWGTSKDDVWAVGGKATVLHYDGVEWKPFPVTGLDGATPDLITVWAADREHVWIGGDSVLLALGGER